ncbi:MAG: hypothetical protein IJ518_05870 [Clostridia bacterium]|nr:hypothetical protein [Clostridia bacterium]
MMKKWIALLAAVTLVLTSVVCGVSVLAADTKATYIDNSSLLPKYVDDDQVVLEDSGGGLMSPDWVKTLMIAEINPMFASPSQNLDGLSEVLNHYAEAGINALWVTPPYDTGDGLGHYGHWGPHTISPLLTGTEDYAEGWKRFKAFVDEAHSKNIRIFVEAVTWGCALDAPMYEEHPEWFTGPSNWGGWAYDWNNNEFREWFIEQYVWLTTEIGVDGFRCDLEPTVTGYEMWGEVRKRALERGEKIALFTETVNERLFPTYDFDEHSSDDETMWENWELYTEGVNIVDGVKEGLHLGSNFMQQTGEGGVSRFYTFRLSCHDSTDYHANGSLVNIGYQAILSPFISLWFCGEEFDNPLTAGGQGGIIYRNPLQLSALENKENRDFFEKVKALIRVRRTYSEIFDYYPTNHRESNICKVDVYGLETLQAYGRYADGKGVIVVPNNNVHDPDATMTVVVPFEDMGIGYNTKYRVTDLLTGKVIVEGSRSAVQDFAVKVPYDEVGTYLVEAVGKEMQAPTTATTTTTVDTNDWVDTDTTTVTEGTTTTTVEETTTTVEEVTTTVAEGTTTTSKDSQGSTKPAEDNRPVVWPFIAGGAVLLVVIVAIGIVLSKKKKA